MARTRGQYTNFEVPNDIYDEIIDSCGDEFKWNAEVFNLDGLPYSAYTAMPTINVNISGGTITGSTEYDITGDDVENGFGNHQNSGTETNETQTEYGMDDEGTDDVGMGGSEDVDYDEVGFETYGDDAENDV